MVADLLQWLGFGLCHQLPERSLFGGGLQVPVCARDQGIYLGFLVAFVILTLLGRARRPSELPPVWAFVVIGLYIGLMGIDGVSSYAGLRSTTNDIRLITGLMTGFAIAALLVPLVNGQAWKRTSPDRVLGRPTEALSWLLALPLTFVVIRYAGPHLGVFMPVLTGAAIILTFVMVNLVIVTLVPPFERSAERWTELGRPILIALAFTFLELALSVFIKQGLIDFSSTLG